MFTKGQKVAYIGQWSTDDMSTYIRIAIVQSCGAKKMTLVDAETGANMGHNFRPQTEQYQGAVVVPYTSEANLYLQGLDRSALWIGETLASLQKTAAGPNFEMQSLAWRKGVLERIALLPTLKAKTEFRQFKFAL